MIGRRARIAGAVVALAGCAADGDDTVGGDATDAATDGDDGGGRCLAPVAEPPWLAATLAGHVQQLAAAPRATVAQRTTARGYLMTQLTDLGLAPRLDAYDAGANVVGTLPATPPSATWLVLGAHFDTVTGSPGANDNATGVAVVLATARALAALPCRRANVAVVLFDQEEVGLIGSGVYAGALAAAGTDVVAVHTVDQAGWDADDDLRFEIEQPSAGLFAEYQDAALAVGAQVVETDVTSTDHQSFRSRGFAAVGVTEEYVSGDTTPCYHQPGDTIATVDAVYHRTAARLVTYVLARELGAAAP